MTLSAPGRRRLLDEYFALLSEVRAIDSGEVDDPARVDEVVDRQMDLVFEYQDGFRPVPLSRCPFTGRPAGLAIDAVDLDGLWWDWGSPLRGDDDLPPSFFALTGAVGLDVPVAPAPFVCRPGPEVPFVIPRLLEHPSVQAVISSLPVGPHVGYPVLYFAEPVPVDLPRANAWGASGYSARTGEGFGQHHVPEDVAAYDWDLGRWLDEGKLSWIAPGDATLELVRSRDDCPYLDLEGRREIPVICEGRVLWDDGA